MQFLKWQLPKVRPSEAPQATIGAERCGKDGLGGQAPRLEQVGVSSAAARTDLGSSLGKLYTFGKLPLGKIPL